MKHIFIVNPIAGKGEGEKWMANIAKITTSLNISAEIYKTVSPTDGERRVGEICENEKGTLRFYACGGDGTLNEVVNGAYGYKKAEVASIPIGSGNDFVRNFPDAGDFFDIASQIKGTAIKVDLMEYEGEISNKYTKRYAINMFNIGFDANVANDMLKFKKYPLIHGTAPYYLSIGLNFITKRGADIRVETRDKVIIDGKILFVNICNGSYLGGGIKGAPFAVVDDSKMDINVVKNVTRRRFANLLPKYINGTHMMEEGIEKIIKYIQDDYLKISPNVGDIKLGVDGEIFHLKGPVTFRNVHKGIKFVIPKTKEI